MHRTYDLHMSYWGWRDDFNFGSGSGAAADARSGRIPVVTWGFGDLDLDEILDGSSDEFITSQARRSRDYKHPMFLRFGIEMNTQVDGDYALRPKDFITAWHRVHQIFTSVGATNVSWVWSPNIDSDGGTTWDDYYPGDSYVDWIGVDGYNTSYWGDGNRTFAQIFEPFLAHFAGRKPLMIGEFATDSSFGDAAHWVDDMGQWVQGNADKYGLRALNWFDVDKQESGNNWRVDQDPAVLEAWKRVVQREIFGGPGYP